MRFLPVLLLAWCLPVGAATLALPDVVDPETTVTVSQAQIHLEGPFVGLRTTHQLVPRAPDALRPLESRLSVTLPTGLQLMNYALDIQGVLRDAVVVERVQARSAFENIVRRNVDPALLEQRSSQALSLRVFPVTKAAPRTIRLDMTALATRAACGWETTLNAGLMSALRQTEVHVVSPVRPIAPAFRVAAPTRQQPFWRLRLKPVSGNPATASICVPAPRDQVAWTSKQGEDVLHFVEATTGTAQVARWSKLDRVHVFWDNSLSMLNRMRAEELALLDLFLAGRSVQVTVSVPTLEGTTDQTFEVRGGDTTALRRYLSALIPEGASPLTAWQPQPDSDLALLFTDAVSTWSSVVRPSSNASVPVAVITSTDPVDQGLLTHWLRPGGTWIDLKRVSPEVANRRLRALKVSLPLPPVDFDRELLSGWFAPLRDADAPSVRACHIGRQASPGLEGLARPRAVSTPSAALMTFWCGRWAVDALAYQRPQARDQLVRLAKQYGVTSAETSLLVLEQDDDYVTFGVTPKNASPELIARIEAERLNQQRDLNQRRFEQLKRVTTQWEERKRWAVQVFPKVSLKPVDSPTSLMGQRRAEALAQRDREATQRPLRGPRPTAPQPLMGVPPQADDLVAAASAPTPRGAEGPTGTVTLTAATGDLETLDPRFATATTVANVMQVYRDVRPRHLRSPSFYLQVAERLYGLNEPALAATVLSSLIEIMPNEHAMLRVVAYRLLQADPQSPVALTLLQDIARLAPDEPTSLRDYGLMLGKLGRCDEALRTMAPIIAQPDTDRFGDVGLITLAEMNALRRQCSTSVWPLPDNLKADVPIDLRIVLTWNIKDTDIDLHVTDPLGEVVSYSRKSSRQGGRISRDSIRGNGPEEFILQKPVPGTYRIEVNFFGSNEARLIQEATVRVLIEQRFATAAVQQTEVTRTLKPGGQRMLVATFEVK